METRNEILGMGLVSRAVAFALAVTATLVVSIGSTAFLVSAAGHSGNGFAPTVIQAAAQVLSR